MGYIKCGTDTTRGNRFKKMVYCYDLISGKVNDVAYQSGSADQFYHHYSYDPENRLVEVKTSLDKQFWESEAKYDYYRHGPLARTMLGQNQVQGLDYAYTLQGWLKGVNSTAVSDGSFDIGKDGNSGAYSPYGRDVFGFSLNYFTGDYKPVSTSVTPFAAVPMSLPAQPVTGIATGSPLYNGNIGAMLVNVPQLGAANIYGYRYDQLNRITRMDAFNGLSAATNSFSAAPARVNDYHEETTYDPNGNIQKYTRNGDSRANSMDNLVYNYNSNTNQLNNVTDLGTAVTPSDYTDIKTQPVGNYRYDFIGNLISDSLEKITNIDWNVYGKIRSITKSTGVTIKYTYDASGNRISKIVLTTTPTVTGDSTYYVRDASGNVMSVYNKKNALDIYQTELHLYGSKRLGIFNTNTNVQNCTVTSSPITIFTRGNKFFELSNHLGNVLATISDKIVQHTSNGTAIDYYNADVVTANDYYPFGMQMPGRKYAQPNGKYRYGFNGQEVSTELNDNLTTAEYWEYDSRIGRRWNIEPLTAKYPGLSGYATLGNNPTNMMDPDGQDVILLTWATKGGDVGHTAIAIQNYKTTQVKVKGKMQTVMVPLNSYNVYEIGPAKILFPSQLNNIVTAFSPVSRGMTKEQILANRGADEKHFINWDSHAPDGIVEFKTDTKYDANARSIMDDKAWSDRLGYKAIGGDGKSCDNCTSYVEEVIPRASGEKVSGTEIVELPDGKKVASEMPTQLFKSAAKLKGAKVLKDIPADLKNKSFTDAYYSPSTENSGKAKKM